MSKTGKVFVTGATGFIGSSLTRQLLEAGYVVRGMSRSKPKAPPGAEGSLDALWNHPNFEYVAGDVNDVDSLTRGMEGCRYAISLAGYARNFARNPEVFRRVNVDGMRNVFAVAKKLNLEKIVWTSTIVTLGPTKKGEIGDENMPRAVDKYYTEYEESKSVAENEARQWIKKGLPLTIVNPTRVYGPGQLTEGNAMAALIRDYRRGVAPFLLNWGKNYGNYGYVDDVARGHMLALEKGKIGERYILGGDNASLLELFRLIDKVDGRRRFKLPLYKFFPLLFANAQRSWALLTGFYPRVTPGWIRTFCVDWRFSCEKAKNELGYDPIPLEEGLRRTCEWLDALAAKK